MARPEYSTTLDGIIAGGMMEREFRVLTCEAEWPDGEPPFAAGERVSVVDVPETPVVYDPDDAWDPYAWVDVTALVSDYAIQQDASLQCDQFSLAIPAGWDSTDLVRVFKEMRIVVIQTRCRGAGQDTGWFNVFWGVSDGFSESYDSIHQYAVAGKDALKLAGLEVLGAQSGSVVFQGDRVTHGDLSTHYDMGDPVREDSEAWEFGITATGPDGAAVQLNWADKPLPQFWCHNVPGAAAPVPLSVGGNAVQAVFGEGVVRVGKTWAKTGPGSPPDYRLGLGFDDVTVPDVRCVLARFAHPACEEAAGFHDPIKDLPSDIRDGLTVTASSAGSVTVDAELTEPEDLTLIAEDGTGLTWVTTGYAAAGGETVITLANTGAVVPVGIAVRYGDANRARDVLVKMLLSCGYQAGDDTEPLYVQAPEIPLILGVENDIVLPPLVFERTQGKTVLEAIEDLRREGYVPPSYLVTATADGQIRIRNVAILPEDDEDIIPCAAIVAPVEIDRSDLLAVTRVVARGEVRKVTDYVIGATIADVTSGDGGLPAAPTGDPTWWGRAVRSAPGANDYTFALALLLADRSSTAIAQYQAQLNYLLANQPSGANALLAWQIQIAILQSYIQSAGGLTNDQRDLRPWAWCFHATDAAAVDLIREDWRGKALVDITFTSTASIDALELNVTNGFLDAFARGTQSGLTDMTGWWAGNNIYSRFPMDRDAQALPQTLSVKYWDSAQAYWLPLVSVIQSTGAFPEVLRIQSSEFDTRAPVDTTKIRIVCEDPFLLEEGTYDESYYYAQIGVYLSRIRVWSSPELIGVAELGGTANWNNELEDAPWPAIRKRLRTRTYVMPASAPWAAAQEDVDWLALQWLKEKVADLVPRRFGAIRPDARLWDTVTATFPDGAETRYLVTQVNHQSSPVAQLSGVNYDAPAYGGEE